MAALAAAGVREVFGVAGGALTPLLRALHDQRVIRYVGVRHEAAGAQMAAAIGHATGRLAVCLGEQGPGTLNVVSGLGGAYLNRLPVLALTVSGHSGTAGPGSGALMELDATLASRAVTTWRHQIRAAGQAAGAVVEAVRRARTGRPGPVHLDIPRDVLAARVPATPSGTSGTGPAPAAPVPPEASRLDAAAAALLAAARPVVIAGGGAARSCAEEPLRRIAAHLGAVTLSTQMGIGVLPSDGPAFAGQGGVIAGPALIRAMREADAVLAAGARFSSWWWRDGRPLGEQATVVRVDSDPDVHNGANGHLLVGDARPVLDELWQRLRSAPPRPVPAWTRAVHAEYLAHRARLLDLADQPGTPAHPAALACRLGALLGDDDLVVLDGGHTTFWSNDFALARRPRTVLHEPGMAQLGFGVPYANALALAYPRRRVVTITGDGAFGFGVAELDTARRLGLRTITVIHDNAAWGVIGLAQRQAGFALGTDLAGTDYAAIAEGFGCLGIRVADPAELPAAFERARSADRPTVIDAAVRFEPHPMMPDFGRTTTPAPPAMPPTPPAPPAMPPSPPGPPAMPPAPPVSR